MKHPPPEEAAGVFWCSSDSPGVMAAEFDL